MRTQLGFAAIVLAACHDGAPPTFVEVGAIVAEHCLGCHAADGVGPFALDRHDRIVERAAAIEEAIVTRYMPPIHIDDSGECQDFVDRGTLSDDEIALVVAWFRAGAPLGDTAEELVPPATRGDAIRVDHRVTVGADFTPDAALTDHYRCFTAPSAIDRTRYITALDFLPGDPGVVHHVSLFVLDSDSARQWAIHRDEEDPGPGFDCFGGAGWPEMQFPAGWSPGMPPIVYPPELGFALEPSDVLMVQVHYNLEHGPSPAVASDIALSLADTVERAGYVIGIADLDMRLPPGRSSVDTTASVTWPNGTSRLYGVMPHMHRRGRALRLRNFGRDGGACLARQERWDYRWHQLHLYERPPAIAAGSLFEITCTFDTSADQEVVTWGDGTSDEMCAAYVLVADE